MVSDSVPKTDNNANVEYVPQEQQIKEAHRHYVELILVIVGIWLGCTQLSPIFDNLVKYSAELDLIGASLANWILLLTNGAMFFLFILGLLLLFFLGAVTWLTGTIIIALVSTLNDIKRYGVIGRSKMVFDKFKNKVEEKLKGTE
ncbi:MAG: hypothetical protein B6242_15795 [Anaerolineaceae bacterium 4572_78]|nr:MAG: hypothetical protein B6242_15795 [Anaerolineaceae bacterium 4572_78]